MNAVMARKNLLREVGYYLIAIGFLVYGGFRIAGAVPAVAQVMGWGNTDIGRSIVEALAPAFPALSQRALIPLSMAAYLSWSGIMGLALTTGSMLALFKLHVGYWLMASYFILFGIMFINYLTFNVKIVHLATSLVLFLIMLRLSTKPLPFGVRSPQGARMTHA